MAHIIFQQPHSLLTLDLNNDAKQDQRLEFYKVLEEKKWRKLNPDTVWYVTWGPGGTPQDKTKYTQETLDMGINAANQLCTTANKYPKITCNAVVLHGGTPVPLKA